VIADHRRSVTSGADRIRSAERRYGERQVRRRHGAWARISSDERTELGRLLTCEWLTYRQSIQDSLQAPCHLGHR
jgi:hypothetical protein